MHGPNRVSPIAALLRPRTIALVGASARGGVGAKMMHSADQFGFDGAIWPVNSNYASIEGRPCFPSLRELPAVPDCVVVAVNASRVLPVLEEAGEVGIPSALVVAEGFADAGTAEGNRRQADLVALARRVGMAVAGPNCMGVATLRHHYAATMADIPEDIRPGGISLVSQSGGLVNAVANVAASRGIGLNYLISIGNQAALSFADYIEFLTDDPATAVIACIMEGPGNGRAFRAAIERAARRKPVVVLKLGRSASGQAATVAHTGTLAGKYEAFAALFRQNGVAAVESIDELVETAALFDLAPLPNGRGVAMLTVSGGATSLIADLGEAAGVSFAPLADATNRRLQEILGVERPFNNPIDTVGLPRLAKDDNLDAVLAALMQDNGIGLIGLVLGMRTQGAASHEELVGRMAAIARDAPKPILVLSFMSNGLTGHWRGYSQEHGLPLVEDVQRGLKSVRHLIDYAAFRRGSELPARPPEIRLDLTAVGGSTTLTEAASKTILAQAGLPVTREAMARTPEEAVRVAAEIGGALAIKVQSPDIPHKSDVGGVYLGARGPDEVARATRQVLDNARAACPEASIHGVLVQEMVEDGAEFFLGMSYDDQLGPLMVCGGGGVSVEVFKDTAFGLAPVTRANVVAMLDSLKSAKLFAGFRGAPPRDTEALIDCCLQFSDFIAATDGMFAAIDLNPVLVRARGEGVRIADALLITRQPGKESDHARKDKGP